MKKVKKYIENLNLLSLLKRIMLLMFAMVLMYFGIACYYQAKLGTDPYSVLVDGEHYIMDISYGQVTNFNNFILFTIMLIFGRRFINIGTIINTLIAGALIDIFNTLIIKYIQPVSLVSSVVLLMLGIVALAVGLGLYIVADVGVGGLEFITLTISDKMGINLKWVRMALDIFVMTAGIILGGLAGNAPFEMIGIGTVLGAIGTGLIMKWVIRLSEPIKNWLGAIKKETKNEIS